MRASVIAAALVAPLLAAGLLSVDRGTQSAGTTFDDTPPDRMVLSAPDYRLTFAKSNGALLAIAAPGAGADISQGSSGGCLWGSVFDGPPDYLGGCSYGKPGSGSFRYSWDAASGTLTLRYTGAPGPQHSADATVTVAAGSGPYFDMHLTVDNRSGSVLRNALFPSDLLFRTGSVQAGYLPYYLPGVRVKPAFFSGDHANVPTYPAGNAFADFLALDLTGTHFALYSLNKDPNPIQPVSLGFIHNAIETDCQGKSFCVKHSYQTWVPSGQSWTSPTVRVVIGQSIASALLSYRRDNGIDTYPSAAAKLGHLFRQYTQAPLIKADASAVERPFRDWIPLLSALPSPSLLHPVGYMRGGHDHSYPDFLPPDSAWGSTRDFAALVSAAHARRLLVMPYTNPTWWTDDSGTIHHLPAGLTVRDISVIDGTGTPIQEAYGPNTGYDASPYVPFVQHRLAQDMKEWRTVVPADCIFEDQIGARPWMPDFNPSSPTPLAYSQGWLDHTERYRQQCLMTENGWDRLAANEVGFNGSLLTWERAAHDPDQFFGAGAWEPYPLALWLLHDKVLLYQHDLSLDTMSNKPGVLVWNMAFGFMLSYDWEGSGKSWQAIPWLDLIGWLQRDVASLYAGQALRGYTTIAPHVTRTVFPAVTILANWSTSHAYASAGNSIAPHGFLAQSTNDTVLAGSFTGRFNSAALSAGIHYLIVSRTKSGIVVRQLVGSDTPVRVTLAGHPAGRQMRVTACDAQNHPISTAHSWVAGGAVHFEYHQTIGRHRVAYYRVADGACP